MECCKEGVKEVISEVTQIYIEYLKKSQYNFK